MKTTGPGLDAPPTQPARTGEAPRWLVAWAALLPIALAVGFLAFGAAEPETLRRLLRKEGPIEHLSHVLLLAAALGFFAAARADRRPAAAVIGLFLTLVLFEEIDWGGVYGWHGIAASFNSVTGSANVHNSWSGHSYLMFAAPVLGYFALAIPRAPAAIERRLGAAAPTREEGIAFALLLALILALAFALPAWERERDELIETTLYAMLLIISLRAALKNAKRGLA